MVCVYLKAVKPEKEKLYIQELLYTRKKIPKDYSLSLCCTSPPLVRSCFLYIMHVLCFVNAILFSPSAGIVWDCKADRAAAPSHTLGQAHSNSSIKGRQAASVYLIAVTHQEN